LTVSSPQYFITLEQHAKYRLMRNAIIIALLTVALLRPCSVSAESTYIGDWMLSSTSVQIAIESWGKDCGTKPQSRANSPSYPVEIREESGQLIFSKGSLRTDACGSPNPKVQSVLAKRTSTYWKRVCQTAVDDPKFEQGEYVLTAVDDNRLEYSAVSNFNWTINGNHCKATSTERRTYLRTPKTDPGSDPSSVFKNDSAINHQTDKKTGSSESESDLATDTQCEFSMPAVRVEISPKKVEVVPGNRVCLFATAYDHNGCTVTAGTEFNWSATQNGQSFPRLIFPNGCFRAGETAAESEGMYLVSARMAGKVATAKVMVTFPDLGDLIAARLDPLDDDVAPLADSSATETKSKLSKTLTATTPAAVPVRPAAVSVPQAAVSVPPDGFNHLSVILIIGLFSLAGICGAVVILLHFKKRRSSQKNEFPEKKRASLLCPFCGRTFETNANFCPYDKSALRPSLPSSGAVLHGMICPKCHRGYDADARFCPHDAMELIPYSEWRLSRMPPPP
jgi:hypothetical protein